MYNQTEAVLSQYDMEIYEVLKGRGSFICNTDKGKKLLVPFKGSKEKGMQLYLFLQGLQEQNFQVEQIELTQGNTAVAEDEYSGERFLLKTYVDGVEISTSNIEEMKQGVGMLAIYHNAAKRVMTDEKPKHVLEDNLQIWERHYRELLKVRNYIRNRKKKTEFEQIYIKYFEHNRKSAQESLGALGRVSENFAECLYCHGDYNQHNILLSEGSYRIVHYENFNYNWPMTDLANFMRKMLEKNEWSGKIGRELIAEYGKYRPIKEMEYQQLYGLLLFPEKFWKVTNHYMNSRKVWISEREIDKLKKVIEQEEKRMDFMENMFAFLK